MRVESASGWGWVAGVGRKKMELVWHGMAWHAFVEGGDVTNLNTRGFTSFPPDIPASLIIFQYGATYKSQDLPGERPHRHGWTGSGKAIHSIQGAISFVL